MIGKKRLRRYCKDFQEIENYQEAVQSSEPYDLHHRKEVETLEDGTVVLRSSKELKDLNLYWNRPPEELIFLKHSKHSSIRKLSEDSKAKISSALKGKYTGENNSMYGRIGEKNPMYGRSGENSPRWKGDLASDNAKYMRLRRQRKREALGNSLN